MKNDPNFVRVPGVDYTTNRWAAGIEHHPQSVALVKRLQEIDYGCFHGYFDWRIGGDGDNGESLMYELDLLFDERDKKP